MTKAVSTFISHLVVHFGEPKFDVSDDDKPKMYREWLKSMVTNLKGFSDGTLAKAAELIVSTRKYRNFPLLSECRDACIDADRFLKSQRPRLALSAASNDLPEFAEGRTNFAYTLIETEMGRRAARDGWILTLFRFCQRNMRLPDAQKLMPISSVCPKPMSELAYCMEGKRSFAVAYERALRGELGSQSKPFEKYAENLKAESDRLAARVLHGVIA